MQSDNAQKEQSQNNVISLVNTSNNFFKSANAKIKPEIRGNNLSLDNDEQGSSSALTQ
ncbi:MAG: hypothetical protein K0S11_660 [Gammaproteobacteria bacterium]|jgi:hypothetical protein|nr:hypothetical protein [Gammaproteobacteria bacterium]